MTAPPPPTTNPSDARLTTVIVEDQVMFMELLRGTIELISDVRVVGMATTAHEGKRLCRKLRPDILILDLALPDGSGLPVAKQLIVESPRAKVLILSSQVRTFLCPEWLHDNLLAVIAKQDTFHELKRVFARLSPRPPVAPPRAADACAPKGFPLLSPQERNVFLLLGEGLTSRAISEQTGLTESTVRTYRKRIAKKLGTTGDELVTRAIEYRVRISSPPPA